MENPLDYDDQQGEIRSQFDQLLSAIISTNDNSSEEDIRALNERVQREVTAKYLECQERSKTQWMVQFNWPVQLVTLLATGLLSPSFNVWKLRWDRSQLNFNTSTM